MVPPPQEKSNGTVQGRCEFLVFLSGDKPRGYKPVAVQDVPPSGPSPVSTLWGPRSKIYRHYSLARRTGGAPWLERCNPSQGADTWMPRSLSVIYCTPSTALGEAGCAKVAPSQGALRLKLLLEIWVPPPLLHSLRLWNTGIKAKGLHFRGLGSPFSA